MSPEDVREGLKWAAGGTGLLGAVVALFTAYPTRLKAGAEVKQIDNEEARKIRHELEDLADRAEKRAEREEKRAERAEAERDHYKNRYYTLWEQFTAYRAGCVGKGKPCQQDPPLIQLDPYKPPDTSHD